MTPLPIDPLLPEICEELLRAPSLVLEAPPGAGKTTRVPPALLDAKLAGEQEVLVLQPRRLPTRMCAQRIAEERGERLGDTVGYQVRFEDRTSERTRLRFVTEGILTRRLLTDPKLRGVGAVVLDEFHERHLATDLALAHLKLLQQKVRPDLKLLVMSATLEAEAVANYLGQAKRLRSVGRRFEVSVDYLPVPDERPLEQQMLSALKRVIAEQRPGDILAFLPGAAEIRKSNEACAEFAERHGMDVLPLHGDLPPKDQDRAVRPSARRKLILSTNVAETSVTIEGVGVVIDSGLAKVASHSPWSGLPLLKVSKVSKASATQRAGRAGRTQAGHCVRLYTRHDFEARPSHETPEIRRMDLSEMALELKYLGVDDLSAFPFFENPPKAALAAAEQLLARLGAVDAGGITALGKRLLRFPLHPRQARVLVEGERRGVAEEAAILAGALGERDLRSESQTQLSRSGTSSRVADRSGPSDLLEILARFERAQKRGFSPEAIRHEGLQPSAAQAVEKSVRQIARQLERSAEAPRTEQDREHALLQSVLAGYPDRVAKRRRRHSPELLLFEGGQATQDERSEVRDAEWLVAVDAEDRGNRGVWIRMASQVEPEWLLERLLGDLRETDQLEWNERSGRVERVTTLSYGALLLDESRSPAPPSPEAARLLADRALSFGSSLFADAEGVEQLRCRLEVLRSAYPEASVPQIDDSFLREAVASLAENARTLSDLKDSSLSSAILAELDGPTQRLLVQAPERITLPGGRSVKVQYEPGKPPWVESRLQDFFGMTSTPKICAGRVALVLHLLAPNHRAVQVTQDLSGFWDRHYPAIRKELSRKYPRHAWPENPRTASPPAPRR